MQRSRVALRVLSTLILLSSGCAPAYHWYEGCRVPCQYCAPHPLPHEPYLGCPCHSRPAEAYLSVAPTPLVNPLDPQARDEDLNSR